MGIEHKQQQISTKTGTPSQLPQLPQTNSPAVSPGLELAKQTDRALELDGFRHQTTRSKWNGDLLNAEIFTEQASKGSLFSRAANNVAAMTHNGANWINGAQTSLDQAEARLGYNNAQRSLLTCLSVGSKEDLQLAPEQFRQYRKEVLSAKTVDEQSKALQHVIGELPPDVSQKLYRVPNMDLPGVMDTPRLPLDAARKENDTYQSQTQNPTPLRQVAMGNDPDKVTLNEAIRSGTFGQYGQAQHLLSNRILGEETQKAQSTISDQDKQAIRQRTQGPESASAIESLRESLGERRDAMVQVLSKRASQRGHPISEEQASGIVDSQIKAQLKSAQESLYDKALQQETIKRLPQNLPGAKGEAVRELRNKYVDGQPLHFSAEERDAFCQTALELSAVALTGGVSGALGRAASARVLQATGSATRGYLAGTAVNGMAFEGIGSVMRTPLEGSQAWNKLPERMANSIAMFATVDAGQVIWDRAGRSLLTKACGIPPEQLKSGMKVGELTGNAKVANAIGSLGTEVAAFTAYGIGIQELDNVVNGRPVSKDFLQRLEGMAEENLKTVVGLKIANKVVGPMLERSLKGMGRRGEALGKRVHDLQGSDGAASKQQQTGQQSSPTPLYATQEHRDQKDPQRTDVPIGSLPPRPELPDTLPREQRQEKDRRSQFEGEKQPRRAPEKPEEGGSIIHNVTDQVVKPVEGRPGQGYPYAHVRDVETDYRKAMTEVGVQEGTPAYNAMLPHPKVDTATGALRAEYLEPAILRAQAEGHNAKYVEIDIGNLGGLNNEMISRCQGNRQRGMESADNVLAHMSDGIRRSLEKTIGLDNFTYVRKGGDEFGIVIKDSSRVDMDKVNQGMQAAVAEVQERYHLENIPHPKDPNKHGVGIYVGEANITPGRSTQEILDAGGVAVEDAKKNATKDAAAAVGQPVERETRSLPSYPTPPSRGEVQHSLTQQRELADLYSSDPNLRTVNDPRRPFVDLETQQNILNREFGSIYNLNEEQLSAAARVKASHVPDVDPTTRAQVASSIYETRLRANSYVEERARLGLPHEATILDADLVNMAGLNKTVGAEKANRHFRDMTSILQQHLEDIPGAQVVPMRRPGASMEYLVFGASPDVTQTAFREAKVEIDAYANREGLSGIHHPKWAQYPEQDGVSMVASTTAILPGGDIRTQDHSLTRSLIEQEGTRLQPSLEKYNNQNQDSQTPGT